MFGEQNTMARQAKSLGISLGRSTNLYAPLLGDSGSALMQAAGVNNYFYQQEQRNRDARQQCARSIAFPCGCRVPLLLGKANYPLDDQCGCGKWVRKEVISDDGGYMAWRKA